LSRRKAIVTAGGETSSQFARVAENYSFTFALGFENRLQVVFLETVIIART